MSDLLDATAPTALGTVYPWHCDHMGHMNVMWYVGRFDEATWHLMSRLGMTPTWLRAANRGMVAVEQHLRYLRELNAGDVFRIESRVLSTSPKTIRFAHAMFLLGGGDDEPVLAATCELTGVHIDTTLRRGVAFPPEIAARVAQAVDAGSDDPDDADSAA